jgi:hypothetical protein
MHQRFGIRTSFVILRVQNDLIVRVLRLSRLTLSDCVAKVDALSSRRRAALNRQHVRPRWYCVSPRAESVAESNRGKKAIVDTKEVRLKYGYMSGTGIAMVVFILRPRNGHRR